jgi:RNA polymerase sigma-70 factor (ECF subfamily)
MGRPPRDLGAPDFAAVLAGARAGEAGAVTTLYRDHNPRLVRYLEGQVAGEGEDLAQEVWVATFAALPRFGGDEQQFRALLFTIARRRTIDHWRRSARRPSRPLAPEDLAPLTPPTADVDNVEAGEAIAELTRHLTPEQADVVLLRVLGGLSAGEVAGIVGKSPGAVRVISHRALRTLAAALLAAGVTT